LGSVKLDSSDLPIITIHTQGQNIVPDNKIDALMEVRYNGPGQKNYITDEPKEYNGHIGIEVRGASSSGYPQQPFGLKQDLVTERIMMLHYWACPKRVIGCFCRITMTDHLFEICWLTVVQRDG
jgi:hypothetical protein